MYSHVPEGKGRLIFFRLWIFFWCLFYVQIGVLQFVSRVQFYAKTSDFYAKLNVTNFLCNKFVSNLVQIDLIQFEFSNCIRSICTKTNTNLVHTNLLHSILRKIGHVIQIVVHQFVHKTSATKKSCLKKIGPPLSPGMREYVESVLRRKKLIPYKPYVRRKLVESILGTCKNMTKKIIK